MKPENEKRNKNSSNVIESNKFKTMETPRKIGTDFSDLSSEKQAEIFQKSKKKYAMIALVNLGFLIFFAVLFSIKYWNESSKAYDGILSLQNEITETQRLQIEQIELAFKNDTEFPELTEIETSLISDLSKIQSKYFWRSIFLLAIAAVFFIAFVILIASITRKNVKHEIEVSTGR